MQIYDKYVNPITYKQNDRLWVKSENVAKLEPLFEGPYTVVDNNRQM